MKEKKTAIIKTASIGAAAITGIGALANITTILTFFGISPNNQPAGTDSSISQSAEMIPSQNDVQPTATASETIAEATAEAPTEALTEPPTEVLQTVELPSPAPPEPIAPMTEPASVVTTEPDGVPQQEAIYWDSNGLFHIEYSLLGMSYTELCSTLNITMDRPEDWPYWGNHLKWCIYDDFELPGVVFMFQDEKCCLIYNDQDRNYSKALKEAVISQFGSDNNAYVTGGNCTYSAFLEDYVDTGEVYLRQQYQSLDMY